MALVVINYVSGYLLLVLFTRRRRRSIDEASESNQEAKSLGFAYFGHEVSKVQVTTFVVPISVMSKLAYLSDMIKNGERPRLS